MNQPKYQPDGYALKMGDRIEVRYCQQLIRTVKVTRFTPSSAVCEFVVKGVTVRHRFPRTYGVNFKASGSGPAMSFKVLA